jgi:hypothetical protein
LEAGGFETRALPHPPHDALLHRLLLERAAARSEVVAASRTRCHDRAALGEGRIMLRLPIAIFVLLSTFVIGTGCGDPQDEVSLPSPAPTQTELERVNEKRALNNQPTFAPDQVDLSQPNIFTSVPESSATHQPPPTPAPPSCGPTTGPGSSAELVVQYGAPRSGCISIGNGEWIVTTSGTLGEAGVIAILSCPPDDDPCRSGNQPASEVVWEIYPGPVPGGVKVLATRPPFLVVSNGGTQMCFDTVAREYLLGVDCVTPTLQPSATMTSGAEQ